MTAENETVSTGVQSPAANGSGGESPAGSIAAGGGALDIVGSRVREERLAQRIGVRELARRVGVSASLISQVELGKASPSVGTLYAIVNELGLSLDELFFRQVPVGRPAEATSVDPPAGQPVGGGPVGGGPVGGGPVGGGPADAGPTGGRPAGSPTADPGVGGSPHSHARSWSVNPVVRRGSGQVIQLATGVQWERLAPPTPQDVDFLQVAYHPGSESCPPDSLMRHSGHEYGHIISGRMGVTIGFDTYELAAGDSIAFDSTMPHRLFAIGAETVEAIWVVVGRRGSAP
ncbi:helix-turn-helix domain-containing protein [Conexibacter sp. S30A1]|uniref:helix-turn-helix domain-containing protein n=1 Tax=Conexibacter sp. S30A1 TaxID=2937800 RepID=UPI00200FBC2F|nr:XRE family transcriptional regulator [Conexibacter sp. S30A1]